MMDIFCEYLVKKKSTEDDIKRVLITLACLLILAASSYLCVFVFIQYLWLLPMIWGGTIYGTVLLRHNFSIEYEYIFTNGQLDIDIIKGRAKRKNMVSLLCKNIEYMAPLVSQNMSDRTVIDAIYDKKRRGKYYVDFTKSGTNYRLLFQPPEKILTSMKKYNPRNVNL